MKKIILTLIILIVLGLLGWQISRQVMSAGVRGHRRPGPMPVAVEIEPVTNQTIRDVGMFTGSLYPKSKFIVAPKIGGRLEKLWVNIGDEIRSNAPIAELENDEYRQQVDQVRAELAVAKANLEESGIALDIATRELERVKALRANKIASESELDAAQAQYHARDAQNKVAVAQLDQKKAALKAAEVRLSYTRIAGPQKSSGEKWVVGERFVDQGAMLAANSPIVSVLDISSLLAVIYVIERDYPKILVGQPAVITTDAHPGRRFQGSIARLAPEIKESSREARVEVEIPNQDLALRPGMFVRVQIEFGSQPDVTVIPLSALVKRNERQGVFLVDMESKKAHFVPITLGIIEGDKGSVLEPALKGNIVTLGQHLLEDGSPVIMQSSETNTEGVRAPGRRPPKT